MDLLRDYNKYSIVKSEQNPKKPISSIKIPYESLITVRRVESPSELYVKVNDMKLDEKVMSMEMQVFYEQNKAVCTMLLPGVKCAYEEKEGKWHRVEVIVRPEDGWCKVRGIDNDEIYFVPWQKLFELDEQFYNFSRFCVRLALGGIKPIEESWNRHATEYLRNNLMNIEHDIKFFGTTDEAKLFLLHRGTKINVNQSLVFFGHARPTDEAKAPEKVFLAYRDKTEELEFPEKLHPVEIVDEENFDPFHFRVKYLEYRGARNAIKDFIQNPDQCDGVLWKVGDLCVIFCSTDEEDKQWHRAVITKILTNRVEVILCEYGIEYNTKVADLRECPDLFKRLKFTTASAKLACTFKRPWKKDSQRLVQSIINFYDHFYINFKDDNSVQFSPNAHPRPVILWGQLNKGLKINIIKQFDGIGLVESIHKDEMFAAPLNDQQDDAESYTYGLSLASIREKFTMKKHKQPEIKEVQIISIKEYTVALKKQIIESWLPAPQSMSQKFHAIVTYIDKHGNIILHEYKHEGLLQQMKTVLNEAFKKEVPSRHQFNIGDPCTVQFLPDNCYYRGIISEIVDKNNVVVDFIDYGNTQKTKAEKLFREVVCVEIPPVARTYRLEGIMKGRNGQVNQELLDKLHVAIVDSTIEVEVLEKDVHITTPGFIKRCWITIDQKKIKSYDEFFSKVDHFIESDSD